MTEEAEVLSGFQWCLYHTTVKFAFFGLHHQSQLVYTVRPLQTSMSLSRETSFVSVLSHLVKEIFILLLK